MRKIGRPVRLGIEAVDQKNHPSPTESDLRKSKSAGAGHSTFCKSSCKSGSGGGMSWFPPPYSGTRH